MKLVAIFSRKAEAEVCRENYKQGLGINAQIIIRDYTQFHNNKKKKEYWVLRE